MTDRTRLNGAALPRENRFLLTARPYGECNSVTWLGKAPLGRRPRRGLRPQADVDWGRLGYCSCASSSSSFFFTFFARSINSMRDWTLGLGGSVRGASCSGVKWTRR